ncbi:MAG: ribbon-helix-helix domain-containing protein [Candidatus Nanohaloarchaea archaeon]|nr:ribbon-helix-helix domain-containing protein [Candidatus Nanohaloarchaea archaeon]
MATTSVEMPSEMKEKMEKVVDTGPYNSNSEFVRDAVRRLLDRRAERLTEEALSELSERLEYREEDLLTSESLEERAQE